jgi:DNA-binding Xre family transcriptional regulator
MHRRLRVKEVAAEKGFTMAALHRAADINLKTLQALYKDPYIDAAYSTLDKIAEILGVPITDLVEKVSDERYNAEKPKKVKKPKPTE